MDNAQKAIMIGVGLFITIIVIAAVMVISGMGQDIINSGTEQIGNVQSRLNDSIIEADAKKLMKEISYIEARSMARNAADNGIEVKLGGHTVDKANIDTTFVGAHKYKPTKVSRDSYEFDQI